jgi:hypothetical protein
LAHTTDNDHRDRLQPMTDRPKAVIFDFTGTLLRIDDAETARLVTFLTSSPGPNVGSTHARAATPLLRPCPAVLAFELANRAYFAASISDRGDEFFDQFTERYNTLLAEQEAGLGAYSCSLPRMARY